MENPPRKALKDEKTFKNGVVSALPIITDRELDQGWYWGEAKRLGTPDNWVLQNKGTRGAKWRRV